jgi:hypothetical protein
VLATSPFTLAPGKAVVCKGSYSLLQSDINAGTVHNVATGDSDQTLPTNTPNDVTVPQAPHISLTKTATPTTYSAAGQVIHYTLVATNDGNVTLHSVSISDPKLGTLTCAPSQPATLAPTGTLSCTGSYTIKSTDLKTDNTGTVVNTATASGLGPQNQSVSATATATVHQVKATGQIQATGTTCEQFKAGTGPPLSSVLYTIKAGKINSVSPGVFFYYSKVTAPASGPFVMTIGQSNDKSWPFISSNNDQIILYDANCVRVQNVTTSYNATTGITSITVNGSYSPNAIYFISVKYDPNSLIGFIPSGKPVVTYTFQTSINGSSIPSSGASLQLTSKK